MTSKTLITRVEETIESQYNQVVVAQAHAALTKGDVVQLDLSDGITEATANNDRAFFPAVAVESIALGAEGKFIIGGFVQAKAYDTGISMGEQLEPMANFRVNGLATQTNGNGFAIALETPTAVAQLIWIKLK